MARPRLISVLGAECTGKTLLCTELARRLPAIHVPEFLRGWCDQRGRTPSAAEQHEILAGQQTAEARAVREALAARHPWVVLDSSPLLTAVYSLEYFDDDSLLAEALDHQRGYALTLVTDTDIPWQPDGFQRDGPARRDSAQLRLRDTLSQAGLAYTLIAGSMNQRITNALAQARAAERNGETP